MTFRYHCLRLSFLSLIQEPSFDAKPRQSETETETSVQISRCQ